ncbi:hypothetical protein [Amycolatopsis viridis]|uniref:Helix-turn-helix domain-containing protein n=1 Tax=Amycolatopsis viridis TaxID=185678 RepID=A0ABX0SYW1_9PSEU|nr:hypothetical protein [Amycolatopsis viridis]NIH81703.1 hypothetical protein [Amycolatopsis viridis]
MEWALNQAPMLQTPAGKHDTTARLVLVALAEAARGTPPQAFLALATIRYKTGLDRRVIQRVLDRLAAARVITAVGTRGDVTIYRLNTALRRPDSDREAIDREVEESRAKAAERQRKSRASRTQNPHEDTMSRTQNPESRTLSANVTHSEPPRTGKGTGNEPVPLERAGAEAPAPDSPGVELAVVKPLPATKRGGKDPAKDKAANDLATRYYEAMRKQVKFMAVREVVRHALNTFTEQQVFDALRHMATHQRNKPLTRQTLLNAIEQLEGHASAGDRPSTTDQRVAAAQALKARLASNGANVLQLPTGDLR